MDAVDQAEIDTVRDVFAAGEEGGYDVAAEEVAGALCPACRFLPDDTSVNRVLGLGLAAPATEAAVDEIVAFYRRQEVACAIAVAPSARPPELVPWLLARGFRPGEAYATYGMRPSPLELRESPLRVRAVPPDFAPEFARVVVEAYEMTEPLGGWVEAVVRRPGWKCYAAFVGGEVVGVSAMFVSGKTAWLAYAGTLPRYRRLGSQSLLFAMRITDAVRLGVETVAGSPAHGREQSAVRKGMRIVYEGRDYVLDTRTP
jgi:hypothetical protein